MAQSTFRRGPSWQQDQLYQDQPWSGQKSAQDHSWGDTDVNMAGSEAAAAYQSMPAYGASSAYDGDGKTSTGDATTAGSGGYYQNGTWVPTHLGVLKSFSEKTGYGFITCAELNSRFGQDIFLHKNDIDFQNVQLGQWVEFAVVINERGQPQARNCVWLPDRTSHEDMALKSQHGHYPVFPRNDFPEANLVPEMSWQSGHIPMPGCAEPMTSYARGVTPFEKASPAMEGEVYEGTLKSYNSESGYGFLFSDVLWQKHNRDVYIHRSELPEDSMYRIGRKCTFRVTLNAKGHPQASNVKWQVEEDLPFHHGSV